MEIIKGCPVKPRTDFQVGKVYHDPNFDSFYLAAVQSQGMCALVNLKTGGYFCVPTSMEIINKAMKQDGMYQVPAELHVT